jgi:hypothetical protein
VPEAAVGRAGVGGEPLADLLGGLLVTRLAGLGVQDQQQAAGEHAVQVVEALVDVSGAVDEAVHPALDELQVGRVAGALVDLVLPEQVEPDRIAPSADGARRVALHRGLHHLDGPVGRGGRGGGGDEGAAEDCGAGELGNHAVLPSGIPVVWCSGGTAEGSPASHWTLSPHVECGQPTARRAHWRWRRGAAPAGGHARSVPLDRRPGRPGPSRAGSRQSGRRATRSRPDDATV